MKKAIVIDKDYGSISEKDLHELQNKLKDQNIELELRHFSSESDIINHCQNAEALLCTGNPTINEDVVNALPNLKIIQRFGIGVNSIDLSSCTKNGVAVLNMPGFCIEELAAHATSLILSLNRNTSYYDRHIRRGDGPNLNITHPSL